MTSQFIDASTPARVHRPEELPHGLLTPPPDVREQVLREKARLTPAQFTAETEERLLNEWTVGHYFEPFPYEVSYRPTPEGPEVLAVGFDEILALRRRIGEEEY